VLWLNEKRRIWGVLLDSEAKEDGSDVRVCVEKMDVWKRDDEVRALTREESEVLVMLREVYGGD